MGLAVLVYLLLASSVSGRELETSDSAPLVVAGASLLIAACAWLLDRGRRARDEGMHKRMRILAAATALLLLPLLLPAGARWVALAAIVVSFAMLTWSWSRLVAGVPLLAFLLAQEPSCYFGAVLIAMGLALQSGRLRDYLRDLFPRPVGGAR